MDDEQKPTWMFGAIAAAFVLIVAAILVVVTRGGGTATLDATSIPGDLRLTLDGRAISQNGQTAIKTGDHTLVASRPGFAEQSKTFKVRKGETARFAFYLAADSEEGRRWYRDHPDAAQEKEGEGSRRYDEQSEKNTARYPMVKSLPYIGRSFRIDYGVSKAHPRDASAVGIYVKEFAPGGREKALEWMRQNKFDPDDYEIIYSTS